MIDIVLCREYLSTFEGTSTSSLYYRFLYEDRIPIDVRKEGWAEWIVEGYQLYLEIHRFIGECCRGLGYLGVGGEPLFFHNLVVDIDCRDGFYPDCEVSIYFVCQNSCYCVSSTASDWKAAVDKLVKIVSCLYVSEVTSMLERANEELVKIESRKLEFERGKNVAVSHISQSPLPNNFRIALTDGSSFNVYIVYNSDNWNSEDEEDGVLPFNTLEKEVFCYALDSMIPFLRRYLIEPEVNEYEHPIYELYVDCKNAEEMGFHIVCHHPYWDFLALSLYDKFHVRLNEQYEEQVDSRLEKWLNDVINQLNDVKNCISKAAENIEKLSRSPIDPGLYITEVDLNLH